MIDAAEIAGVLAAAIIIAATLALTFGRMAWHALSNAISRRLERVMAEALARPLPGRYRDLEDEYRALVIAQHNEDH